MKTVFSGIQPSGNLHIGNYIGAVEQWVRLQDRDENIYMLADLHTIITPQDPNVLREKVKEVTALYLASGIDPKKSHIFVQSENYDHPYLAWIFDTILSMGQLSRMTQYKDKSAKNEGELSSVGIFNYPALMASDILLYDPDEVPVGEDQKQHVELTRDIAEKFNKVYGPTFKIPAPRIDKETARIMSLQNPTNKMSKSEKDPQGTINLLDSTDEIAQKIRKAVTDSGSHISKDKGSAGLSNLLTIYSAFKNQTFAKSQEELDGKSYADFKSLLVDLVVERLEGIQKKYNEIRSDDGYLRQVLDEGREYAASKSSKKVADVKRKMGLS